MRLLLDTHVYFWWLLGDRRLRGAHADLMANPAHVVQVSAASIWEIGVKSALGKLDPRDVDFLAEVERSGFVELPIHGRHAVAAASLPPHHRDPFDRVLIAQARVERLTLLTVDPAFQLYDVETL